MAQKIRHGRQILDRILDGLATLDELAQEINDSLLPPNIRLIEDAIRAQRIAIEDLRQLTKNRLDPLLQRRGQAETRDDAPLRERLAVIERQLADTRERLAVIERSIVPDVARTRE